MKRSLWAVILISAFGSLPVQAQRATGGVVGFVTDPDGYRLAGVEIFVQDLDAGLSRAVSSNTEGRYHVVALPPGEYRITAKRAGFQAANTPVHVPLGSPISVDIVMHLQAFSGTIDVRGEGRGVRASELDVRVPLVSDATQVALLTPGVIPGDKQYSPVAHEFPIGCPPRWGDVLSGWGAPGQQVMAIGGASVAENSYQLNGLNITDFSTGLGSSFVPIEFVDEIRVETGGLGAHAGGSLGGVINMVTKRGSNLLQGSFSAYWRPGGLQEQEPDTLWQLNQLEEREGLEVNATIGGPIVLDRLFFFLFGRYVDGSSVSLYDLWGIRHEVSDPFWGARIDWNINSNHHLEGTWFSDGTEINKTRFDFDAETGTEIDPLPGWSTRGGHSFTLSYSGVLRDNFLLSVHAGLNQFDRTNRSEGDNCPQSWEAVWLGGEDWTFVPVGCWVNGVIGSWYDTREAFRIDSDWLLGRHSLRAGVGLERIKPDANETFSGGVAYTIGPRGDLDYPEVPVDATVVQTEHLDTGGDYENRFLSAYVHDSWAVSSRVTLDLGVRWERYDYRNAVGNELLDINDAIAPRLGVVWDPTGRGRTAVHASAGLYHMPVPANINYRWGLAEFHDLSIHVLDGEILPDGSPSGLGEELWSTVFAEGEVWDPKEVGAQGIEPMAQSELTVGFDRMIGRTWTIGIRGVARRLDSTVEDFSINQGLIEVYGLDPSWAELRIGNPGTAFNGFYDLEGDGTLDPITIPAEALGYPRPERHYYAIELRFDRRYAANWALSGSYTWSHLYGNYEGLVNSDLEDLVATAWAGNTWTYDFPAMLEYAFGDLPNDRRHTVKLFGSYAFDCGLQIGWNAFYSTGRPVNSFGLHPTDPWALYYWVAAFYTDGEPMPRGSCGRTEDLWSMDLLLRYDFNIAGLNWWVRADAFNLFNNSAVTEVDEAGEYWWFEPNPSYGFPTVYQAPRTVRLGFGFSF
jgi:hypothetical protein